jgi:hypothetical protein
VRIAERALLETTGLETAGLVKIGAERIEAVSAVTIGGSVRIGDVLVAIAAANGGKAVVVRAAAVPSKVPRRSMSRS